MKIFLQRSYINIILLIALIILAGSNIFAYQQTQRLIVANEWVVHTYEVIDAANQVQSASDDAVFALEQAIIANKNQKVLLAGMTSYFKEIDDNVRLMRFYVQDNPSQEHRLDSLESLLKIRHTLLQETVRHILENQSIIVLLKEHAQHQILRSSIENAIDSIVSEEQRLLLERDKISVETTKKNNLILILTMGLGDSLFLLSLILLNYYLSQRDHAERKRAETEDKIRLIVDGTKDHAIFMLSPEGIITTWNAGAEKIKGYSAKEIIGKHFSCLYPIEAIKNGIPEKQLQVAQKQGRCESESFHIRKDGTQFLAGTVITALFDQSGDLLGFGEITRDLTERDKVEKLKNEFLSVISHELRTPITSIRGALGLIIGGTVGKFPDKAEKLLDIANQNCERLLLLINDILDMEKIEAGKMDFQLKIIDLRQVVQEAIASNKIYAEKYDVKINLVESIENIKVNVDADRIIQVLTNLLSNAIKFSLTGSVIHVTIAVEKDMVRVSVINKGHGISKEFQPFIFQKFSQADSSNTRGKGGSGLGLHISKVIIERMGGALDFNSIPNEETTFYFELPIWRSASMENDEKNKSSQRIESDKLLICEDDADQAKYLQVLLETVQIESDIAYTVAEAKTLLATKTYRGILLDLILPDQDGITFIRDLRNDDKTRQLPIIVQSVIAKTGRTLLNGEVFSVIEWLEKPIDFTKLLQAIAQIKLKTAPDKPRVLNVEDDIDTQDIIKASLAECAHITSVICLDEAKEKLRENEFDVVILDLLLPDGNGVDLLPLLSKYNIPVIVYSAIELDPEYAKYVHQALIKSKTSNEELINAIRHCIKKSF